MQIIRDDEHANQKLSDVLEHKFCLSTFNYSSLQNNAQNVL